MAILREDEVQRCREWQKLARNYNEVNENEGNLGLDSSKPAAAIRGAAKPDAQV